MMMTNCKKCHATIFPSDKGKCYMCDTDTVDPADIVESDTGWYSCTECYTICRVAGGKLEQLDRGDSGDVEVEVGLDLLESACSEHGYLTRPYHIKEMFENAWTELLSAHTQPKLRFWLAKLAEILLEAKADEKGKWRNGIGKAVVVEKARMWAQAAGNRLVADSDIWWEDDDLLISERDERGETGEGAEAASGVSVSESADTEARSDGEGGELGMCEALVRYDEETREFIRSSQLLLEDMYE